MKNNAKAQVRHLAVKMSELSEEIREICDHAGDSIDSTSISMVQFNIQKHVDFLVCCATEGPPDDVTIQLTVPERDNPLLLKVAWDEKANGYRIKNVPIELAAVARAIDAELANRQHSGAVRFDWFMIPADLLGPQ